MLLHLTLAVVILFLLWELRGDKVHVEELFLPLGWVRTEVFVVSHGLAKASGHTGAGDIDQVLVSHLSIDIKSINIVQILLDSTYLLEVAYLVKSPVRLILVAIVLPNVVRNISPSIEPMFVRFPPLQRISFCKKANVG